MVTFFFRYVVFTVSSHMKVQVYSLMCVCVHVDDSESFSYAFWYSVFLGHGLGAQPFELLFVELHHQLSLDALLAFQRLHEYESFLGLTKSAG